MKSPATELIFRAVDELGCKETSVEGFDNEDAALLDCDFEGASFLLQIAREVDPYGGPEIEVGVYKR